LVYIFEELEDGHPELFFCSVEAGIDNFLSQELPQAFYQVQIGGIGRKKNRLYFCSIHPFDEFLISVVAGIMAHQ
jgi:hypothetical protein